MNVKPLLVVALGCMTLARLVHAQALPVRTLAEDLRITSDETSRERSLTAVSAMTVLSDGTIVLFHGANLMMLDNGSPVVRRGGRESVIRVYDARGRFMRVFGRTGDGPGEFGTMAHAGSVGDNIWIHDLSHRRTSIFTVDGALVTEVRDPVSNEARGFDVIALLEGSRLLVKIVEGPPATGRIPGLRVVDSTAIAVVDSGGNIESRLATPPRSRHPHVEVPSGNGWTYMSQYLSGAFVPVSSDGGSAAAVLLDPDLVRGAPGSLRVVEQRAATGRSERVVAMPRRSVPSRFVDSLADFISSRAAAARGGRTTPDPAQVRTAVQTQMYRAEFFPVVAPRTTYPVSNPVLMGRDGALWIKNVGDPDLGTMIVDARATMQVRVPEGTTLHVVSRENAWGVREDGNGVPIVIRYRLR